MKQDNYVSFSIVVGFFLGLIISVAKFNTPELIILGTIIGTAVVYLIVICCVSFYMKFLDYDSIKMNTPKLDSTLEFYVDEFDRREKETANIRRYLKHNLAALRQENQEEYNNNN